MASPLETFMFMFTANTAPLEAGIDAADTGAEQLEQTLSDIDRVIDSANAAAGRFGRRMLGVAAGLVGFNAIMGSIRENLAEALEVTAIADQTNLAVEQVSALRNELRALGGENYVDALTSSLERIAEEGSDSYGTLLQLAAQLESMSQSEALKFVADAGISIGPELVDLLRRGPQAFEELIAVQMEAGVLTEAQADAIRELNYQLRFLGQGLSSISRDFVVIFEPAVRSGIDVLQDIVSFLQRHVASLAEWAANNGEVIEGLFYGIAAVLTGVVLPAAVRTGLALWTSLAPIIPFIALLAALAAGIALVYEDYQVFARGGDSVLGRAIARWPVLAEVIDRVRDSLQALTGVFDIVRAGVDGLFSGGFSGMLQAVADEVDNLFNDLVDVNPEAEGALRFIQRIFLSAIAVANVVGPLIGRLMQAVVDFVSTAIRAILLLLSEPETAVRMIGDALRQLVADVINAVLDSVPGARDALQGLAVFAEHLPDGIRPAWEAFFAWITERFGDVIRNVANTMDNIGLGGIGDAIRGAFNLPTSVTITAELSELEAPEITTAPVDELVLPSTGLLQTPTADDVEPLAAMPAMLSDADEITRETANITTQNDTRVTQYSPTVKIDSITVNGADPNTTQQAVQSGVDDALKQAFDSSNTVMS